MQGWEWLWFGVSTRTPHQRGGCWSLQTNANGKLRCPLSVRSPLELCWRTPRSIMPLAQGHQRHLVLQSPGCCSSPRDGRSQPGSQHLAGPPWAGGSGLLLFFQSRFWGGFAAVPRAPNGAAPQHPHFALRVWRRGTGTGPQWHGWLSHKEQPRDVQWAEIRGWRGPSVGDESGAAPACSRSSRRIDLRWQVVPRSQDLSLPWRLLCQGRLNV